MITRKRAKSWRTSAPEKLAAARTALAPLRPSKGTPARWALRGRDGVWRDDEGNTLPTDTGIKFENHVDASARAAKGSARRAGKEKAESKTQRSRSKYAPLVAECERRGVSLGIPHDQKQLDAVMVVADELDSSLTRAQVLKHLQRHQK